MVDSVHIYRMLSELRDINHGRMTFYGGFGFGIPALVILYLLKNTLRICVCERPTVSGSIHCGLLRAGVKPRLLV